MAIDPRISLMGQPSNIRQAVMGGLEIGEELRNRGVRDNILRQSEQVNQMNIAQAQGKYKYQLFSSLKSVPIEQRAALFAQQMPMLEQMGITGMPDLSDQGLDQQIMATKPFMAASAQANTQFGSTFVTQDAEGNTSLTTQARDPNTGEVKTVSSPVDGQLASTLGETAGQKSERAMRDALTKAGIDTAAFANKQQLEAAYAELIATNTAVGTGRGQEQVAVESFQAEQERLERADDQKTRTQVAREEALARVALQKQQNGIPISADEATAIAEANARVARNTAAIDVGIDAAKGLVPLKRSIELLKTIKTGGWNAVSYNVRARLGIEGGTEGELANNLGKAVMSQLRATFGAQFTAREGDMLFKIEAGWSKSTAANQALLNNLLDSVEARMKRAENRARDAGDNATADELRSMWNAEAGSWSDESTMPDNTQQAAPTPIEAVDANGNTVVYNPATRQWEAK